MSWHCSKLMREVESHSLARTVHSFACLALLASLARSAAPILSLADPFTPDPIGKKHLSMKRMRRILIISTAKIHFIDASFDT